MGCRVGGRARGHHKTECLSLTDAVSVPHPTPTPFRKITSRSPLLQSWLEGWPMVLRFDFTSVFCTVASWGCLAQVEGGLLVLFSDRNLSPGT